MFKNQSVYDMPTLLYTNFTDDRMSKVKKDIKNVKENWTNVYMFFIIF